MEPSAKVGEGDGDATDLMRPPCVLEVVQRDGASMTIVKLRDEELMVGYEREGDHINMVVKLQCLERAKPSALVTNSSVDSTY